MNDNMTGEIKEHIGEIGGELEYEAVAGHPLLGYERSEDGQQLFLTRLLLISAKMNKYDFLRLKPVAIALELLNLAVKKHYELDPTAGTQCATVVTNLSLITGDYYYAKALSWAAQLEDANVIKVLSQAVANIAEGAAVSRLDCAIKGEVNGPDSLKKMASLYGAACYLGAYLSGSDSEALEALKSYGQNLGAAREAMAKNSDSRQSRAFLDSAKQSLFLLSESSLRTSLANILASQS